jgi:hypothetical protein
MGTVWVTPSPESSTIPVVRPEAYKDNTAWAQALKLVHWSASSRALDKDNTAWAQALQLVHWSASSRALDKHTGDTAGVLLDYYWKCCPVLGAHCKSVLRGTEEHAQSEMLDGLHTRQRSKLVATVVTSFRRDRAWDPSSTSYQPSSSVPLKTDNSGDKL